MKKRKAKIVVIGGGTGLSTLLRGLKHSNFDLTAIVTVADDGGSSGRLRDDYDIPPPGDVRNVIAALSKAEPLVEEMFQYRFTQSKELEGHSLGNLMLAALTEITGDFNHAIAEMSKVLNVNGRVIPAANKKVTLHGKLIDGTTISGESNFAHITEPIDYVYLEPDEIKALPAAVRYILRADYILVGPGSLYTSIIPNLLVKEIGDAVAASRAKKVYICNLMTQAGETINYTASDHIQAIHKHVGKPFIDAVLMNDKEVPERIKETYLEQKAEPVIFDVEKIEQMGIEVIRKNIATIINGVVRHSSSKIADFLHDLVEEEK
jgi:uncharacterized cofD-like protein